jgi:hypothetical protein
MSELDVGKHTFFLNAEMQRTQRLAEKFKNPCGPSITRRLCVEIALESHLPAGKLSARLCSFFLVFATFFPTIAPGAITFSRIGARSVAATDLWNMTARFWKPSSCNEKKAATRL